MTRKQLRNIFNNLHEGEMALMERKNRGYANAEDPFANLRAGGMYGIAVRLGDKVARLHNMLDPRSENVFDKADDEPIIDTIRDMRNYAGLLYAMMCEEEAKIELAELSEGVPGAKPAPKAIIEDCPCDMCAGQRATRAKINDGLPKTRHFNDKDAEYHSLGEYMSTFYINDTTKDHKTNGKD